MSKPAAEPPAQASDAESDAPLPGSQDPGALAQRHAAGDPDHRLAKTGPLAWMAANSVAANLLMLVLVVVGLLLLARIKQEVSMRWAPAGQVKGAFFRPESIRSRSAMAS